MHFVDQADVLVVAGNGGSGKLSFRREKFVAKGGPDGGDGGDGGDVIVRASRNQNTLAAFRFQKELVANSGNPGESRKKHGRSAQPLIVDVPVGTVITAQDGRILADLTLDGEQAIIARGGKGGFGNAHFVSSTRQAPRIVEQGEPGERLMVHLELKLIADVGLVGLPNSGKSTLLSVISNARPEIADYPFTTLTPNLGVVAFDAHTSALFADIPGLIAGAAQGKGLGDAFLRHIERTLVVVHLIDAYQRDVGEAYTIIQQELAAYKTAIATRPQIVLLNKTEGLAAETIAELVDQIRAVAPNETVILPISAQAHIGLQAALYAIKDSLLAARAAVAVAAERVDADATIPILTAKHSDTAWHVEKGPNGYVVRGAKIERFALRVDMRSSEGAARIRDIMQKMGIIHELVRHGIQPGDHIIVGDKGHIVY